MKFLQTSEANFKSEFEQLLARGEVDVESVSGVVGNILGNIKKRGLHAVKEQVREFDGWDAQELAISPKEMKSAWESADSKLKEALQVAYKRILAYHEQQVEKSWFSVGEFGEILGQKVVAVDRAGVYVPGGKAAYPSSLLMNVAPARAAGVGEVVVCTPAIKGEVNSLLLAAMHLLGVTEAYKVGGASAIGLMAYGARDEVMRVRKVDVVTGPGNIYVATAKKLVFGEVNVDMIAGPSEVGIIADESASAKVVATDLLSQAEHDEMASSFLLTPNLEFAREVERWIWDILPTLSREKIARASVQNRTAIIVAKNLGECVELANELAVEHLEIATREAWSLLGQVKHAGAIFLGHHTSEAFGDYLAGPNHTLPTGATAKFFSPLGVEHFTKKSSVISLNEEFVKQLGEATKALAYAERLDCHARSVEVRQKD